MNTTLINTDNLIPANKKAREGWEQQLAEAIQQGHLPDDELLEGFNDLEEMFSFE